MGLKNGNTVGICACRGEGLLVGEGGSDLAEAIKVVDITGKRWSRGSWNPRMRCAEPLRQPSLPLTIRNTIGVQAQHPSSQRMLAVFVEAVGAGECCFGGQIWQRDFLHSVKDQSGQRQPPRIGCRAPAVARTSPLPVDGTRRIRHRRRRRIPASPSEPALRSLLLTFQ